VSQSSEFLPP